MTFKELLDLCSWEDLEDFLYEFPDAGMGEGRWKMEGFHRMYDELCRMTPKGSKRKIRLRKPRTKAAIIPSCSPNRRPMPATCRPAPGPSTSGRRSSRPKGWNSRRQHSWRPACVPCPNSGTPSRSVMRPTTDLSSILASIRLPDTTWIWMFTRTPHTRPKGG